jgi:serine/threonine protein kinase
MGRVYLGRSAAGRLVAVKTIKPELAEEEGFRTRFAQEVAAARRVSGVFTAAVVAAEPDADVPWLATAYVPAPSLRALVRACGPLPPATVRWLAAGCAEALESIHGAGLVHLDLKPSNVLVGTDGPKVIDFGVARAASRIPLTGGRGPLGTPAYMSPEQARDPSQASAASDVFALGATLLFAATGHPPFQGETTADVLVLLATALPDLTDLPAELTGLVTDCLDRSPGERPSSGAILARLGRFTEAESYFPGPALTLIEDYQRKPQTSTPAAWGKASAAAGGSGTGQGSDGEQTAASYPALPAKVRPDASPLSSRGLRSLRSWRNWLRLPAWASWSIAGAVLVAAGVVLGATLTSSGSPQFPTPPPPVNLGPVCPASGLQALCVNESVGDTNTIFTVQASGFPAGTGGTLTVTFYPPPTSAKVISTTVLRVALSTLQRGSLRLGPYSLGVYKVVASWPGGPEVSTAFQVLPANGSLPPAAP